MIYIVLELKSTRLLESFSKPVSLCKQEKDVVACLLPRWQIRPNVPMKKKLYIVLVLKSALNTI